MKTLVPNIYPCIAHGSFNVHNELKDLKSLVDVNRHWKQTFLPQCSGLELNQRRSWISIPNFNPPLLPASRANTPPLYKYTHIYHTPLIWSKTFLILGRCRQPQYWDFLLLTHNHWLKENVTTSSVPSHKTVLLFWLTGLNALRVYLKTQPWHVKLSFVGEWLISSVVIKRW